MGIKTDIGWCDSTLNLQAGCDGCELWTKKNRVCYAGLMTERYGGRKGWPETFGKPSVFPERIKLLEKWPDLKGAEREDKPWIPSSMPRMIFLDDMGDTFTESLPIEWLLPFIPTLERSPHIIQFLTKRPKRMFQFFEMLGHVPDNFWLGTSITDRSTMKARLPWLLQIRAKTLFVSFEPMFGPARVSSWGWRNTSPLDQRIHWLIVGGQSGINRVEMSLDNLRQNVEDCQEAGVPVFVKQDSGLYPGQQGRIPDELWIHEFPEVDYAPPQPDQPALL